MKERVAVVTGGNRGIGFEISRQLARQGFLVVLTSRDEKLGRAAVDLLQKDGLPVRYFGLDVISPTQVRELSEFMEKEFGRCDVLINNAGIFPDMENADQEKESGILHTKIATIRKAMETNVYGPIMLIEALVPLMKKNKYGRIINISSGMGQLTDMNGGYPAYRISKTALNAVTRITSQELKGSNILVNSMCPGWVMTRMGGDGATRTTEEGADTAVWLATLEDNGPSGSFFRDRKEIPW